MGPEEKYENSINEVSSDKGEGSIEEDEASNR